MFETSYILKNQNPEEVQFTFYFDLRIYFAFLYSRFMGVSVLIKANDHQRFRCYNLDKLGILHIFGKYEMRPNYKSPVNGIRFNGPF